MLRLPRLVAVARISVREEAVSKGQAREGRERIEENSKRSEKAASSRRGGGCGAAYNHGVATEEGGVLRVGWSDFLVLRTKEVAREC